MARGSRKSKSYAPILETIFFRRYKEGAKEVSFTRQELEEIGISMGVPPKNLGDLIYSFRFRAPIPEKIQALAPEGRAWIIRLVGRSRYAFALVPDRPIVPQEMMAAIKVPDSTPGLVARYSFNDEQALSKSALQPLD